MFTRIKAEMFIRKRTKAGTKEKVMTGNRLISLQPAQKRQKADRLQGPVWVTFPTCRQPILRADLQHNLLITAANSTGRRPTVTGAMPEQIIITTSQEVQGVVLGVELQEAVADGNLLQ
jgi:hypothetical protein